MPGHGVMAPQQLDQLEYVGIIGFWKKTWEIIMEDLGGKKGGCSHCSHHRTKWLGPSIANHSEQSQADLCAFVEPGPALVRSGDH